MDDGRKLQEKLDEQNAATPIARGRNEGQSPQNNRRRIIPPPIPMGATDGSFPSTNQAPFQQPNLQQPNFSIPVVDSRIMNRVQRRMDTQKIFANPTSGWEMGQSDDELGHVPNIQQQKPQHRKLVNRKIIFTSRQTFQFFLQMIVVEYLEEALPIPLYLLMLFRTFEEDRSKRVRYFGLIPPSQRVQEPPLPSIVSRFPPTQGEHDEENEDV